MTVIVGGGIIGLSLAFELSERGVACEVWESDRVGCGAVGAAAGMLAPVSEAEEAEADLVELALESRRRYPDFARRVEAAAGRSVRYRDDGTLWLAVRRDDLGDLDRMLRILHAKGLDAERLDGAALRRREPLLSGRVQAGLHIPGDHQVDPRALIDGLVGALQARGVAVHEGRAVRRVASAGDGRWTLEAADGRTVPTERVVLAAGAHNGALLGEELPPVRVRPVKGQVVRLADAPALRHVLRTPEVYLVPRDDGQLLLGATVEEMGFDRRPTAGAVLDLLREAWQVVPAVYEAEIAELSVGLRPAFADHRPRIGQWQPGLWIAGGHYRNGVLLAPVTAALLAERLSGGETAPLMAPFAPDAVSADAGPG